MSIRSGHTAAIVSATMLLTCASLVSQVALAPAASVSRARAVTSAQFVLKPAIDGDRLVYVRSEAGLHSVWLEDLRSGRVIMLSDPNRSADNPDIHGSRVVWEERCAHGSVVVLCDLETLDIRPLTEGFRDCAPSIWGDGVVWTRESGMDSYLMYMDLRTGHQGALVPVRAGTTSSLCDGKVVHDSGGDLHLIDLRTAEQQTVVDSPYSLEFPDLDGDMVVYVSWSGSLGEIDALDLTSGRSVTIVSDGWCAYAPAINGDTIAWESYCVPSGSEVHLARLTGVRPLVKRDAQDASIAVRSAFALLGSLTAHIGSFQVAVFALLLG